MKRREPPPIATWLLEHSALAERDDALAGDLEEEFRCGRSTAWYWRQALAALAIGWLKGLNQRGALFLFSVLWAGLAPVWAILIDRLQNRSRLHDQVWRMDWPFGDLSRFAVWFLLNLVFLWAGLFLFHIAQAQFKSRISLRPIARSFLRALSIFLPVYFGTFVVMNLLSFPGPHVARTTMLTVGELIDLRTWAIALRVPYFITLLVALWHTRPLAAAAAAPPIAPPIEIPATAPHETLFQTEFDRIGPSTLLRFLVFAGLVNSLIASILLCRLPSSHAPSFANLAARAILYVATGALAGAAGQWWYWRRSAAHGSLLPLPYSLFALTCATGWIWIPAVVLFAAQESSLSLAVAAISAAGLAAGLRRIVAEMGCSSGDAAPAGTQKQLFAETLRPVPRDAAGCVIAMAISFLPFALHERVFLFATGLVAAAVFLFVWKRTFAPVEWTHGQNSAGRGGRRVIGLAFLAVLATLWALLDGVDYRNRVEAAADSSAASTSGASRHQPFAVTPVDIVDGYESVILWPEPPRQQIVAPIPARASLFAPRSAKPLIIRFDGPYWYFQAPEAQPGPEAHKAHASPFNTNIRAANLRPLEIEADQKLAGRIPVSACREIVVEALSEGSDSGTVALALQLKDSRFPQKPAIELGPQALEYEDARHSSGATALRGGTARFLFPLHARLRSFDEITVRILTGREHAFVGPRIVIQQFELTAR